MYTSRPLSELWLGLLLLREDEDVEGDGGEDQEDDEAGQHQTLLVVVLLRARHLLHTQFISSASKSSIRRFVITEKAPTRAFSWLKAATTAITFKTLLRHYAKQALTPYIAACLS